jgi:peptide deformylase
MAVQDILLLGNPALYEVCSEVERDELDLVRSAVEDLHDTMMEFRERHGFGKAIAAPQIGVMKRIVYMHIDKPVVFINPYFSYQSKETVDVWDDCMSFPELFVRVKRHARCRIEYLDLDWRKQSMDIEGDLSELLQHELDHLDGVLAVQRAVDERSFGLRSERHLLEEVR